MKKVLDENWPTGKEVVSTRVFKEIFIEKEKYPAAFIKEVELELQKRNINVAGLKKSSEENHQKVQLALVWKFVIVLLPFLFVIYSFIAAYYLGKGKRSVENGIWNSISLGYVLYNLIILFWALYYI